VDETEIGAGGAIGTETEAGVEVATDAVLAAAGEGIETADDIGKAVANAVTVPFRELASRIEGKKI